MFPETTDFSRCVVHGRVNATQIHCFSQERVRSLPIDKLRLEDFNRVKHQISRVINDFCI